MKEIWNKHYEKIVLGALALCFIFALLYLLQMLDSANEVTEDQLRFRKSKANYEIVDTKAKEYKVSYKLGEKGELQKRVKAKEAKYVSELLIPTKMLRCKCKTILPWDMARRKGQQNAVCPKCGEEMDDPGEPKDYASELAMRDTDGDGMPDRYERRMGFNLTDSKDAAEDADKDGFSNFYEYIAGTNPTDAQSYPALSKCLYLEHMRKTKLPLKLDNVMRSGNSYSISMTVNNNLLMANIGDEFLIRKNKYKIQDVKVDVVEKQEDGVVNKYEVFTVIVAPLVNGQIDKNNIIFLKKDEDVFTPAPMVFIRDVRNDKRYSGTVGRAFKVKSEDKKDVTFVIVAADLKSETVTLEDQEALKTSQKREDAQILLKWIKDKNQKELLRSAYKKEGSNNTDSNDDNKPKRKRKRKNR